MKFLMRAFGRYALGMQRMSALLKVIGFAAGVVCCLIGSGCTTAEMKGTPFYTGEYGKRRGPAAQRVNAWPLLYYREPALSVLWPIFELTDDHSAVRPLFSVYGLGGTNREYNVLWPLAQFDSRNRDNHIFPVYWSSNHFVMFPLYWHYGHPFGTNRGSDALFPLWGLSRRGTNELSVWALGPLVHYGRNEQAAHRDGMVFPFFWHEHDPNGSLFISPVWMSGHNANGNWRMLTPLFYQSSNDNRSVLVTPLWAQGSSERSDWKSIIPLAYWDRQQKTLLSPLWAHWQTGAREHYLAPWSLSWATCRPQRTDLWLAGALGHASWGREQGSHYLFPLYYRDARAQTLLTPICGWSGSHDYFYPFTPLAGVRTNRHAGSWLFPVYSHAREKQSGNVTDHFLVLGGHSKKKGLTHTWFYPVFSFNNYGPRESRLEPGQRYGHYGSHLWCASFCWYKNESHLRAASNSTMGRGSAGPVSQVATNGTSIRSYSRGHGAFPLWSYSSQSTPAEGKSTVKRSLFVLFYDYKHEIDPTPRGTTGASYDYTRARVCWRLWHYERQNGDVSVDAFPAFTYDRRGDGFRKSSFLWRFFRYERAANGTKKLNVLFVPVRAL